MNRHFTQRRGFLRQLGALSALGAAGAPMALNLAALGNAAAQGASDYKALVCVFLYGGNDAYNTVLATDDASWSHYEAARAAQTSSIALKAPGVAPRADNPAGSPERLGGVLALDPIGAAAGRSFALHPSLGVAAELFNTHRRLAVVSNVGPLMGPTSKAQATDRRHAKPAKLYSHNDQQSTWQAGAPEGATVGWGGRLGDLFIGHNGSASMFTCVSASGNAVWLSGKTAMQYQVGANGPLRMGLDAQGRVFESAAVGQAMLRIVQGGRGNHLLEADHAAVARRSIHAEQSLTAVLPGARTAPYGSGSSGPDPLLQYTNIHGASEPNELARQLQIVARMITAGRQLGLKRQVFFVSLGGFDTHANQNVGHAKLMLKLSHALGYFDTVLDGLGLQESVTTFTASEFGRTFTSNGDGTDHGWGAHHFVMGGAVKGGQLYGRFPVYASNDGRGVFASPDQLDGNGVLLPGVSVDQYACTLGRWFGVSEAQALQLWPRLSNWGSAERDLGFMNT